jgi:cytoskeletal protein RodZ
MAGLGEELRAAREARNLSLSDVSERIHIRSVYLQSLEDENWGAIAAPVYVRGFLRTYARFLGLDAEAAVERFNTAIAGADAFTPPPPRDRSGGMERTPSRRPSAWLWAAAAVALVLVVYVGYRYYDLQSEPQAVPAGGQAPAASQSAAPAVQKPATRTVAAVPQQATGSRTVVVKLTARSWVRVEVDGNVPMEGIFDPGTTKTFHGKTATVRAGNAAGVDVTVNGKNIGPLGAAGDVVERTFTLAQE